MIEAGTLRGMLILLYKSLQKPYTNTTNTTNQYIYNNILILTNVLILIYMYVYKSIQATDTATLGAPAGQEVPAHGPPPQEDARDPPLAEDRAEVHEDPEAEVEGRGENII